MSILSTTLSHKKTISTLFLVYVIFVYFSHSSIVSFTAMTYIMAPGLISLINGREDIRYPYIKRIFGLSSFLYATLTLIPLALIIPIHQILMALSPTFALVAEFLFYVIFIFFVSKTLYKISSGQHGKQMNIKGLLYILLSFLPYMAISYLDSQSEDTHWVYILFFTLSLCATHLLSQFMIAATIKEQSNPSKN